MKVTLNQVCVVDKQHSIRRPRKITLDHSVCRQIIEILSASLDIAENLRILRCESRQDTSNMRCRHTCPAQRLGKIRGFPGTHDIETRRVNIDTWSVIGKVYAIIVLIQGTNCDCIWRTSGRAITSIFVRITSGNNDINVGIHSVSDSIIYPIIRTATNRHVDDRNTRGISVLDHPEDTCPNPPPGSASIIAHDLD